MGTARSWREMGTRWREATARSAFAPAAGDQRPLYSGELEEFDWDSLRRAWDDGDSHQERAEQSLTRLNHLLAVRRRNRRLVQLAALLLTPVVLLLAVRGLRQSLA